MSVQSLDIISVNLWQILISLANLLIIYLILKKVLFAKVQGVLNPRQHQVTEMYDAADQSRTDAESMKQEYEEKLHLVEKFLNIRSQVIKIHELADKYHAEDIAAISNVILEEL